MQNRFVIRIVLIVLAFNIQTLFAAHEAPDEGQHYLVQRNPDVRRFYQLSATTADSDETVHQGWLEMNTIFNRSTPEVQHAMLTAVDGRGWTPIFHMLDAPVAMFEIVLEYYHRCSIDVTNMRVSLQDWNRKLNLLEMAQEIRNIVAKHLNGEAVLVGNPEEIRDLSENQLNVHQRDDIIHYLRERVFRLQEESSKKNE